ncbi:MAG: hypothetical protein Q9219_000848 [cf. Caloplaca sp. 3 TL-2023]
MAGAPVEFPPIEFVDDYRPRIVNEDTLKVESVDFPPIDYEGYEFKKTYNEPPPPPRQEPATVAPSQPNMSGHPYNHYHDVGPPRRPQQPGRLEIIFYSCSRDYLLLTGVPCILILDCSNMPAPEWNTCLQYSGLSPELSNWFFSRREYQVKLGHALDKIEQEIEAWRPHLHRPQVIVVVKCKYGVHRSVAMAERLAHEVNSWGRALISIKYVFR